MEMQSQQKWQKFHLYMQDTALVMLKNMIMLLIVLKNY